MQTLFRSITKLDILTSKTIAAACMKHFRTNHLPDNKHLALVTEKGYGMDRFFKQSTLARKFLKWYEHHHKVPVQSSESPQYEKRVDRYYVDGFVKACDRPATRDLIVEVHGCFWYIFIDCFIKNMIYRHACPIHHTDDKEICGGDGLTAAEVRRSNAQREAVLRQHADVEIYWECQIQ